MTIDLGGALISAISRTQKYTAKSVGEAEYGALSTCAAEVLFYCQVLESLGFPHGPKEMSSVSDSPGVHMTCEAPMIFSDSTTALANAVKPKGWFMDKFKHIEIHYHFLRQFVQKNWLKLRKVSCKINPSDHLTKGFDSADAFKNAISTYTVELPVRFGKD